MNRIIATLALVSFAFGIQGCSSPEEKAVKLMEEMANIVDSNKEDCDKMGAALTTFVDANADTIKGMKDMKSSKDEEKKLEEKYGDRIKAATGKMMGGMMKCATNEKVAGAMKKM